MFKPKQKHRLVLLMCVAVLVLSAVMLANAYERPMNATMDYVPQNVGIYDTYYCEFKESDCRACHGTTTAWRHHDNELAVRGQCQTCHDTACFTDPYTAPERDCKECHVDGACINVNGGQLGFPHHRTGLAGAGICTACHSSTLVSDANDVEPPQFDPTTITPKPTSCENCHWPSTIAAAQPPPLQDWNLWSGFPKPTTWPDSLAHPAKIEANGPVTTGSVVAADPDPDAGKPFRPLTGTHHELDGEVSPNCVLCHGTAPGGGYQLDPTYPYAIRACENCHDIYTLHDGLAYEHTQTSGGIGTGEFTIGGVLNQVVLGNEKCVACHGDLTTGPMPQLPFIAPIIAYLEPPMASAGVEVTIYDALGGADFGNRGTDDRVVMQQGISGLIEVNVVSWNPDKIVFEVPGAIFTTNSFVNVVVQKKYWAESIAPGGNDDGICDPGETCQQNNQNSVAPGGGFYLRQHPILNFLAPDSGTWGTIVTINGVTGSFFGSRENTYNAQLTACLAGQTCYGYSTYVELVASNDTYRAIEMSGDGWSAPLAPYLNNSIQINVRKMPVGPTSPLAAYGTLLDVPTDYYVPLADLYKGNWQLYVITDFFKKNIAGDTSPYMLKHVSGHLTGKIDPNSTVLYREISDPLPFFATDTPFISSSTPSAVKALGLGAVYGINFGTTQDTSTIRVRSCTNPLISANLAVVQWSNTRVVFRAPNAPPIPPGGANACVQVTVPKAAPNPTVSNLSDAIWFYP